MKLSIQPTRTNTLLHQSYRLLRLALLVSVMVPQVYASSFRILTIKNDKSAFGKQFFAGFSSSTPEKVIAFDYFGENGRVLSRKIKEIHPDLILTIGELPIFSSVSDFPSTPFLMSNFQSSNLENRNNVILINHSISIEQKISMLTFLFPGIKTIGTVYDPVYSKQEFESFALAATTLGIKVLSIKASSAKEVSSFIQGFKGPQDPTSIAKSKNKIDAFYHISDNTTGGENQTQALYDFLQTNKIPSLSSTYADANKGAVITVAPDPLLLGEKAWAHAHKILQEGKISDRKIYLDEDQYILSLSLQSMKTFEISEKTLFQLTEQAVDKGWKVFWQK